MDCDCDAIREDRRVFFLPVRTVLEGFFLGVLSTSSSAINVTYGLESFCTSVEAPFGYVVNTSFGKKPSIFWSIVCTEMACLPPSPHLNEKRRHRVLFYFIVFVK